MHRDVTINKFYPSYIEHEAGWRCRIVTTPQCLHLGIRGGTAKVKGQQINNEIEDDLECWTTRCGGGVKGWVRDWVRMNTFAPTFTLHNKFLC